MIPKNTAKSPKQGIKDTSNVTIPKTNPVIPNPFDKDSYFTF